MAEISYAQWQCNRSDCHDPMSASQRTKNGVLRKDIPSHWEVAQQCIPPGVKLIDTEQAALREGRVALDHLLCRTRPAIPQQDRQHTTLAITSLEGEGIHWLSDFATWSGNTLNVRQDLQIPAALQGGVFSSQFTSLRKWIRLVNTIEKCTSEPEFTYSLGE